jgi:protein-tyrosine phosphatase
MDSQSSDGREEVTIAAGFIDVHCHLLPGIDDGCALVDDALECIRNLKEAGFAGSICTPHFLPTIYPENLPKFVAERTASLQREVDDAGLDYHLWPGAEVRLDAETTQWFERYGVPTLAGSRYVLVDYFGRFWPEFADDGIRWLIERDYKPILAHPERMGLEEDDLKDLIDRLFDGGVLMQGNLACFASGEGLKAAALAADWLLTKKYFCLATDVHRPGHWPIRSEGLDEARGLAGEKTLSRLLSEAPRTILQQ